MSPVLTPDEIRAAFRQYPLHQYYNEYLEKYLQDMITYNKDPTSEHRSYMAMSYQIIYSDVKHAWVAGYISEEDFDTLADILNAGIISD